MDQTFTKQFMMDNCGCYDKYNYQQLMNCSFINQEPITLESILNSEIPLRDKYWFVCKKLVTKEQNQQIAIKVAEIVLPIYERRYPNNKALREAIEAAKQYIAGHISLKELRKKRNAAAADAAAAAAAAAADAAAAAADAAVAAAAAADAASDAAAAAAANDAANDAVAATAVAAAADIKLQLLDYLLSYCIPIT
jgi:immunity protein Imm5 of predicted polymorphic toxin system